MQHEIEVKALLGGLTLWVLASACSGSTSNNAEEGGNGPGASGSNSNPPGVTGGASAASGGSQSSAGGASSAGTGSASQGGSAQSSSGGSGGVTSVTCPAADVVPTPLRRLTRFEYANTVKALLNVDP